MASVRVKSLEESSSEQATRINLTMYEKQRRAMLDDFGSRWEYTDDRRHYRDWRYLTVHPFADEPEILNRISCTVENCKFADAWWHMGEDIALLQTHGTGKTNDDSPACLTTCGWYGEEKLYLSIVAKIPQPFTTLESLHILMDRIASHELPIKDDARKWVTLFEW